MAQANKKNEKSWWENVSNFFSSLWERNISPSYQQLARKPMTFGNYYARRYSPKRLFEPIQENYQNALNTYKKTSQKQLASGKFNDISFAGYKLYGIDPSKSYTFDFQAPLTPKILDDLVSRQDESDRIKGLIDSYMVNKPINSKLTDVQFTLQQLANKRLNVPTIEGQSQIDDEMAKVMLYDESYQSGQGKYLLNSDRISESPEYKLFRFRQLFPYIQRFSDPTLYSDPNYQAAFKKAFPEEDITFSNYNDPNITLDNPNILKQRTLQQIASRQPAKFIYDRLETEEDKKDFIDYFKPIYNIVKGRPIEENVSIEDINQLGPNDIDYADRVIRSTGQKSDVTAFLINLAWGEAVNESQKKRTDRGSLMQHDVKKVEFLNTQSPYSIDTFWDEVGKAPEDTIEKPGSKNKDGAWEVHSVSKLKSQEEIADELYNLDNNQARLNELNILLYAQTLSNQRLKEFRESNPTIGELRPLAGRLDLISEQLWGDYRNSADEIWSSLIDSDVEDKNNAKLLNAKAELYVKYLSDLEFFGEGVASATLSDTLQRMAGDGTGWFQGAVSAVYNVTSRTVGTAMSLGVGMIRGMNTAEITKDILKDLYSIVDSETAGSNVYKYITYSDSVLGEIQEWAETGENTGIWGAVGQEATRHGVEYTDEEIASLVQDGVIDISKPGDRTLFEKMKSGEFRHSEGKNLYNVVGDNAYLKTLDFSANIVALMSQMGGVAVGSKVLSLTGRTIRNAGKLVKSQKAARILNSAAYKYTVGAYGAVLQYTSGFTMAMALNSGYGISTYQANMAKYKQQLLGLTEQQFEALQKQMGYDPETGDYAMLNNRELYQDYWEKASKDYEESNKNLNAPTWGQLSSEEQDDYVVAKYEEALMKNAGIQVSKTYKEDLKKLKQKAETSAAIAWTAASIVDGTIFNTFKGTVIENSAVRVATRNLWARITNSTNRGLWKTPKALSESIDKIVIDTAAEEGAGSAKVIAKEATKAATNDLRATRAELAKIQLKQAVQGFTINYSQDVFSGAARGFYDSYWNQFLFDNYGQEMVKGSTSGVVGFMTGFYDSALDSQSFYDGMIGAIGGFILPRFSLGISEATSHYIEDSNVRAEYKEKNFSALRGIKDLAKQYRGVDWNIAALVNPNSKAANKIMAAQLAQKNRRKIITDEFRGAVQEFFNSGSGKAYINYIKSSAAVAERIKILETLRKRGDQNGIEQAKADLREKREESIRSKEAFQQAITLELANQDLHQRIQTQVFLQAIANAEIVLTEGTAHDLMSNTEFSKQIKRKVVREEDPENEGEKIKKTVYTIKNPFARAVQQSMETISNLRVEDIIDLITNKTKIEKFKQQQNLSEAEQSSFKEAQKQASYYNALYSQFRQQYTPEEGAEELPENYIEFIDGKRDKASETAFMDFLQNSVENAKFSKFISKRFSINYSKAKESQSNVLGEASEAMASIQAVLMTKMDILKEQLNHLKKEGKTLLKYNKEAVEDAATDNTLRGTTTDANILRIVQNITEKGQIEEERRKLTTAIDGRQEDISTVTKKIEKVNKEIKALTKEKALTEAQQKDLSKLKVRKEEQQKTLRQLRNTPIKEYDMTLAQCEETLDLFNKIAKMFKTENQVIDAVMLADDLATLDDGKFTTFYTLISDTKSRLESEDATDSAYYKSIEKQYNQFQHLRDNNEGAFQKKLLRGQKINLNTTLIQRTIQDLERGVLFSKEFTDNFFKMKQKAVMALYESEMTPIANELIAAGSYENFVSEYRKKLADIRDKTSEERVQNDKIQCLETLLQHTGYYDQFKNFEIDAKRFLSGSTHLFNLTEEADKVKQVIFNQAVNYLIIDKGIEPKNLLEDGGVLMNQDSNVYDKLRSIIEEVVRQSELEGSDIPDRLSKITDKTQKEDIIEDLVIKPIKDLQNTKKQSEDIQRNLSRGIQSTEEEPETSPTPQISASNSGATNLSRSTFIGQLHLRNKDVIKEHLSKLFEPLLNQVQTHDNPSEIQDIFFKNIIPLLEYIYLNQSSSISNLRLEKVKEFLEDAAEKNTIGEIERLKEDLQLNSLQLDTILLQENLELIKPTMELLSSSIDSFSTINSVPVIATVIPQTDSPTNGNSPTEIALFKSTIEAQRNTDLPEAVATYNLKIGEGKSQLEGILKHLAELPNTDNFLKSITKNGVQVKVLYKKISDNQILPILVLDNIEEQDTDAGKIIKKLKGLPGLDSTSINIDGTDYIPIHFGKPINESIAEDNLSEETFSLGLSGIFKPLSAQNTRSSEHLKDIFKSFELKNFRAVVEVGGSMFFRFGTDKDNNISKDLKIQYFISPISEFIEKYKTEGQEGQIKALLETPQIHVLTEKLKGVLLKGGTTKTENLEKEIGQLLNQYLALDNTSEKQVHVKVDNDILTFVVIDAVRNKTKNQIFEEKGITHILKCNIDLSEANNASKDYTFRDYVSKQFAEAILNADKDRVDDTFKFQVKPEYLNNGSNREGTINKLLDLGILQANQTTFNVVTDEATLSKINTEGEEESATTSTSESEDTYSREQIKSIKQFIQKHNREVANIRPRASNINNSKTLGIGETASYVLGDINDSIARAVFNGESPNFNSYNHVITRKSFDALVTQNVNALKYYKAKGYEVLATDFVFVVGETFNSIDCLMINPSDGKLLLIDFKTYSGSNFSTKYFSETEGTNSSNVSYVVKQHSYAANIEKVFNSDPKMQKLNLRISELKLLAIQLQYSDRAYTQTEESYVFNDNLIIGEAQEIEINRCQNGLTECYQALVENLTYKIPNGIEGDLTGRKLSDGIVTLVLPQQKDNKIGLVIYNLDRGNQVVYYTEEQLRSILENQIAEESKVPTAEERTEQQKQACASGSGESDNSGTDDLKI